jgi:tetratricopeptide (TPR) repeat protein
MALLGIGLVMVIVVLPKLVSGRTGRQTVDSTTQTGEPTPNPTIASTPPTPTRPADAGIRRMVNEALEEGRTALADHDAAVAVAAFRRASNLEPGNTAAEKGMRQSEALAEAQGLETVALAHETHRETEAAVRAAKRALELDPNSEIARGVIRRAAVAAKQASYRDLVTRGLRALEARQYQPALDAFSKAAEQQPAAPEVVDGLTRARAGLERETVSRHLARAADAERLENWALAVDEFRSVLALQPTLAAARGGAARCTERLELSRKMSYHLANPDRLATTEVLQEAADLVTESKTVTPRGPQWNDLVDRLDTLVTEWSIPVPVVLVSDGLTEIVVFRVGEFGAFDRRTIDLRPGAYTVVGRRPGFRDVRIVLKVDPGQPPPALKIVCTEAI